MSAKSRYLPHRAKYRARDFKFQPTDAKTPERRNVVGIAAAAIVGGVLATIVLVCALAFI